MKIQIKIKKTNSYIVQTSVAVDGKPFLSRAYPVWPNKEVFLFAVLEALEDKLACRLQAAAADGPVEGLAFEDPRFTSAEGLSERVYSSWQRRSETPTATHTAPVFTVTTIPELLKTLRQVGLKARITTAKKEA